MSEATLIDPLGRSITLHDNTWYGHIIKGHPEMASRRAVVELAIIRPTRICYSKSSAECRLYFANDSGTSMLLVVVADIMRGFVKTAYLSKAIKGTVEW